MSDNQKRPTDRGEISEKTEKKLGQPGMPEQSADESAVQTASAEQTPTDGQDAVPSVTVLPEVEDELDRTMFDEDAPDPDDIGFSPVAEGLNVPMRDIDGPLAFGDPDTMMGEKKDEELVVRKPKKRVKREVGSGSLRSLALGVSYLAVVLLVGICLGIAIINIGNDLFAFTYEKTSTGEPVLYSISITNENMTPSEVGKLLKDEGVIKYDWVFKLYAQLKKKDNFKVKVGEYTISAAANYDAIMSVLNPKPKREEVNITFAEGLSTDDIIDLFLANGIGTREGFENVLNNYDFDYWFMDGLDELPEGRYYRLDGYLYPDTYRFFTDSSEIAVIDKLLDNFSKKFSEDYKKVCDERGMSVDEVVRFASIIEAEAQRVTDYTNVSSVFHNRRKSTSFNGLLQSDATVQYYFRHIEGRRHDEITPDDLKVDTPYNTYLYPGLTPGAVCNPSLNALKAALYPSDTSYYYFVSRPNGYMYYASTLAEHNANIKKAQEEEASDPNIGDDEPV